MRLKDRRERRRQINRIWPGQFVTNTTAAIAAYNTIGQIGGRGLQGRIQLISMRWVRATQVGGTTITPTIVNGFTSANKIDPTRMYMWDSGTSSGADLTDELRDQCDRSIAAGCVPLLSWPPGIQGDDSDVSSLKCSAVAAGDWDAYIDTIAAGMAAYNKPIILRIMHEMNGGWYSWAVGPQGTGEPNTPAEYVSAWQRIYTRFQSAGATRVKFFFCPSNLAAFPSSCYPGKAYVHMHGFDMYLKNTTGTPYPIGTLKNNPAPVSSGSISFTSPTTQTSPAAAATVAQGDFMVIVTATQKPHEVGVSTVTDALGGGTNSWTRLTAAPSASPADDTRPGLQVWYRIAQTAGSVQATVTWTGTAVTADLVSKFYNLGKIDNTTPFDAATLNATNGTLANPTALRLGAKPTKNQGVFLGFLAAQAYGAGTAITTPSGSNWANMNTNAAGTRLALFGYDNLQMGVDDPNGDFPMPANYGADLAVTSPSGQYTTIAVALNTSGSNGNYLSFDTLMQILTVDATSGTVPNLVGGTSTLYNYFLAQDASKPIIISELGITPFGGDPGAWYRQMWIDIVTKYPGIRGVMWFYRVENNVQISDWRTNSSAEMQAAHQYAMNSDLTARVGPLALV